MNIRTNTAEFKRLDRDIVKGTADVEAMKWRQAELAFEAKENGATTRHYGEAVGRSAQHVSILIRTWGRFGDNVNGGLQVPLFADAYEQTKGGGSTSGGGRSRRAGRQVPTDHDDQVEVMQKLVTTTSDDAIDELLDDPVVKHRLKQKVDENEAKRKARRTRAKVQAQADPAGKVVRDAIAKMNLYAGALDMLAEEWIYALEDVPPELKAKLAKAAGKLEAAAHRMVEATKGRRALRAVK